LVFTTFWWLSNGNPFIRELYHSSYVLLFGMKIS
jgi:hypothetical protein